MPFPAPRTQHGPLPGYANPDGATPTRFNRWHRPSPVADMGRSPGLMFVTVRGNVLGAGQIRRMWRQAVNYIPAPPPYSWTTSSGAPSDSGAMPPVTRALRYMTRSVYMGAGIDNTRFAGYHTRIVPQVRSKPVTLGAGLVRSRPTVRNRLTSFGSRVPPLNQPMQATQGALQATQGAPQ